MSTVVVGKKVPDFTAPATGDKQIRLNDLRGSRVVIYFYPKDNTPGCTTESLDFQGRQATLRRRKTVVLGVSRDSLQSHENFKAKHGFSFDLISDPDEALCQMFDVIKEKNMYGRTMMGIERSTFLIDETGVLRQEWRKVRVKGHVEEVLDAIKAL